MSVAVSEKCNSGRRAREVINLWIGVTWRSPSSYLYADATGHLDVDAKCLGNHQDVREENGRVQVVAPQRLERHLRDVLWVLEQLQEVFAGLLLVLAVLWQMPTRLSEKPHRRSLDRQSLRSPYH